MNSQTKKCNNCSKEFIIEPQDFAFYEKMKVPEPTFCPDCRLQRRLGFYNLTNLYERQCDFCKKQKISMYAPEAPYQVYCPHCWWSDNWDFLDYGQDYDFTKPFFEQFNELWRKTPLLGLSLDLPTALSSPHNNHAGHLKNCYLLFDADRTEESAYGIRSRHNRSVFDCSLTHFSELCFDCMQIYRTNRGVGLDHTAESLDCSFLRDCVNCQNCFACANLRNKKYFIFNKPHTKEQYFEQIKKWDLGSYQTYQQIKRLAQEHWKKFPPHPVHDKFSTNVKGNYVFQSKNCQQCYEVRGAEDCKYLFMLGDPPIKDCYDISSWGDSQTFSYECCVTGEQTSNIKFCQEAGTNLYNAEYCKLSIGGAYHFGCVSNKKGEYCILNKKYSKNDYFALREKIIKHMNEMPYIFKSEIRNPKSETNSKSQILNSKPKEIVYRYGEFFPIALSPWAYNETIAQKLFPLSKQQALNQGYKWKDKKEKQYKITMFADQLPDHIKDAPNNIIDQVIGCSSCPRGFRIIPMELNFLRRRNLPLPHQCPFCRIEEKFNQWVKNLRMIKRQCSQCNAEFETSYPKNEVENMLCKRCYLQDVV